MPRLRHLQVWGERRESVRNPFDSSIAISRFERANNRDKCRYWYTYSLRISYKIIRGGGAPKIPHMRAMCTSPQAES